MVEAKHQAVFGPSGHGKTTLLRELHAEYDGVSIFLTTKANESGVKGKRVKGMQSMVTAGQGQSRWHNVRMKVYDATYPDDIQTAREYAHGVTDNAESTSVQIIVDECQEAPSFTDGTGPVKDGLHRDRDKPVKWVISTQSPQDLRTSQNNYGPIQQCKYIVWVGVPNQWHDGFLSHHFGGEYAQYMPDSKYRYHVIEPTVPPTVAYKGRTKKQYG